MAKKLNTKTEKVVKSKSSSENLRQVNTGAKSSLVSRLFSNAEKMPFDAIEWETRTASVTDDKGKLLFEQKDVEVPKDWSNHALDVSVSKYFFGERGTNQRENSVRQLIGRVANSFSAWGLSQGYFNDIVEADAFKHELEGLSVYQYSSFNSPVWFNVGLQDHPSGNGDRHRWDAIIRSVVQIDVDQDRLYPQGSACFIQSVEDKMAAIMRLATIEANLFKWGSGTGTDLSTIRSTREKISGGGTPSGPLSFLKVYDEVAAQVKSGGKTRRAAKMNSLKDKHPDVFEFVVAKLQEEMKAWSLIEQGYSGEFGGAAYDSVDFQNANLSVRLTDGFMKAALSKKPWQTKWVTDPTKNGPTYGAHDLLELISIATWACGDPGVQYDDTINKWHGCMGSGRINASNPCSEFMFLDNSACNLASMRLTKFLDTTKGSLPEFNLSLLEHTVKNLIIAQDINVDASSYPTAEIALNSHNYRPLGLGYADLGSLLMTYGLAYGSDEGRTVAAVITAAMTGIAYEQSANVAKKVGAFEKWDENKDSMIALLRKHKNALDGIDVEVVRKYNLTHLLERASKGYDYAIENAQTTGLRNAQVTLLAPCGTIGFLMDCDTLGIEPDMALVKYKKLVGGGMMKITNNAVGPALKNLGYDEDQITKIVAYLEKTKTIEGAPELNPEHLSIFDCSMKPDNGVRSIHYMDHIKMMAAVQPFLSGAISKTVNMPQDSTPQEIMDTYIESWKLGLKAVAIYRDGSKRSQPINTSLDGVAAKVEDMKTVKTVLRAYDICNQYGVSINPSREIYQKKLDALEGKVLNLIKANAVRKSLPKRRESFTEKFSVGGHEGYITVGHYEDGLPGEIFVTISKEGSTAGGLMDQLSTAWSLGLQYGVPLKTLTSKMMGASFEPSGFTGETEEGLQHAKSYADIIGKKLNSIYLTNEKGQKVEETIPWGYKIPKLPKSTNHDVVDLENSASTNLVSKTTEVVSATPNITVAVPSLASKVENTVFRKENHLLDVYCRNCASETMYKADDNCLKICQTCSTPDKEGCGG